ncbi:MAG: DUF58 domain-containing protein [Bacteroidales bacterium]|jgi:uncharacterized protein (DUF58 family)|nr:DUF58 domain-containing protein [Bacteroidales bacterium]
MFIRKRFYIAVTAATLCFVAALKSPLLFTVAQFILWSAVLLSLYEVFVLFVEKKSVIRCIRESSERLSNGDDNEIKIHLSNFYPFPVEMEIIDEIPAVFQRRDVLFRMKMDRKSDKVLTYVLQPVKRGEYTFGALNVFVGTRIGFVFRRFRFDEPYNAKVYPSFARLKQFSIKASSDKLTQAGNKKIKRIGQQLEPEQIKDYVKGDDYRAINWKATARRNKLMVNAFQDERAQNLFCVIDKGRTMQAAFNNMTLLDYSINASLAIAYIAMMKGDNTGLVTFERKLDSFIPPARSHLQMHNFQESLYNQKTTFAESDYFSLFGHISTNVKNRSLLLIFSNFDSTLAINRQLNHLKMIAKRHTVLVIFFENFEIEALVHKKPENKTDVYESTVAQKLLYEKRLIMNRLKRNNILTLLTHPAQLTVNLINKYMEIKERGNW